FFFFSSRRRHTRSKRDWSSDVCSSGLDKMAELKNCERCGEIFASIGDKDVCPKCGRQEEEDFQKVYRFLTNRKNREATILEIVEATGVEEDLIIKFMKQNRLRA